MSLKFRSNKMPDKKYNEAAGPFETWCVGSHKTAYWQEEIMNTLSLCRNLINKTCSAINDITLFSN